MSRAKIFLGLSVLVLLGAGCARSGGQRPPQPPTPPVSRPTQPPVPPEVAQAPCPITPEIVQTACGVTGLSAGSYPCTVQTTLGKSGITFPFFQVVIQPFRQFVPGLGRDSGTIADIIEARRTTMNQIIAQQGQGLFTPCDRIETKSVAGLGDEAFLAPLTLLGCDQSRVASLSKLEQAPWLFIRKGNMIAEVAALQGDYGGNPGCSSEETLRIAREHVLTELGQ